eukprot:PhM_4_TR15254/c0_g1_i3/m.8465
MCLREPVVEVVGHVGLLLLCLERVLPHLHAVTAADGEQTRVRDVHRRGQRRRVLLHVAHGAQIPHTREVVRADGHEVVAAVVDGHVDDGAAVRRDLEEVVAAVRAPKRHGAVGVADAQDVVRGVAAHRLHLAHATALHTHERARRHVKPREDAGDIATAEQEVLRQELKFPHLGHVAELVHLDAVVAVDVRVLLLCGGEEPVVVQVAHVVRAFLQLNLRFQREVLPFEARRVAARAKQDERGAVDAIVEDVGAEGRQVQVVPLLGCLCVHFADNVVLPDCVRLLALVGFKVPHVVLRAQHLRPRQPPNSHFRVLLRLDQRRAEALADALARDGVAGASVVRC